MSLLVTLRTTVQVAPGAIVAPEIWILVPPATAAIVGVPQFATDPPTGLKSFKPIGNVSRSWTLVAALAELFLIVNVKSDAAFGKITAGAIAFPKTKAGATVAVAVAGVPFETPCVVVMAPMGIVLIRGVPDA